jgi:hypothetical protein
MFRVGDRIWCSIYGWGEVNLINEFKEFGLNCFFDNGKIDCFLLDGRNGEDSLRVIFFDEIKPQESAFVRPIRTEEEILEEIRNLEGLAFEKDSNNFCVLKYNKNYKVGNECCAERIGTIYMTEEETKKYVNELNDSTK